MSISECPLQKYGIDAHLSSTTSFFLRCSSTAATCRLRHVVCQTAVGTRDEQQCRLRQGGRRRRVESQSTMVFIAAEKLCPEDGGQGPWHHIRSFASPMSLPPLITSYRSLILTLPSLRLRFNKQSPACWLGHVSSRLKWQMEGRLPHLRLSFPRIMPLEFGC